MLIALAAACSKAPSECERFIDKTLPIQNAEVVELGLTTERNFFDDAREDLVATCNRDLTRGQRDPRMDCVLRAVTVEDVRTCYEADPATWPEIEAEAVAQLRAMAWSLRSEAAGLELPKGEAGLTPGIPCCHKLGLGCRVNPDDWQGVWRELAFTPKSPLYFQYSFKSDGVSFMASTVGDPHCAGSAGPPVTYMISGRLDQGRLEVSEPIKTSP